MPKYSKKAQRKIETVMHEYKHGALKSGRSKKKVKSRKQAVAIAISEARQSGAQVPKRKTGGKTREKTKSKSRSKK